MLCLSLTVCNVQVCTNNASSADHSNLIPYSYEHEQMKNKAGYIYPIPVADGWAGAEMHVFSLFDSMVTDRPTNQPTDGRTKPLLELSVRN